ncbi:hypothetical protein [Providencia manganoxydans]
MNKKIFLLCGVAILNSLLPFFSNASAGECDIRLIKEIKFDEPLENFKYGYLNVNDEVALGCRIVAKDKLTGSKHIIYSVGEESKEICNTVSQAFFSSSKSGVAVVCDDTAILNDHLRFRSLEIVNK